MVAELLELGIFGDRINHPHRLQEGLNGLQMDGVACKEVPL